MRIIVDGQNLRVEGARILSPEELRDQKMDFIFSRDWDRYVRFAQFTQGGRTYNRMLVEGQCRIPPEIGPGDFYLHVTGMTPDNHERVSSCYVRIHVPGGFAPMPPCPPLPMPPAPSQGEPAQDGQGSTEPLYEEIRRRVEEALSSGMQHLMDPTLTQEGKAADAKATGEALQKAREETEETQKTCQALADELKELGLTVTGQGKTMDGLVSLQAGARLSVLESARGSQDTRLQALEGQMQETRSQADAAWQSAEAAGDACRKLQEKTERDLEKQARELEEEKKERDRLNARVTETEKQADTAGRDLKNTRQMLERARESMDQLEHAVGDQGARVRAFESRVTEFEQKTREILRSIDTLNQSVLSNSVALDRIRQAHPAPPPVMPGMPPMHGDPWQAERVRELQERLGHVTEEVRRLRGRLDENTGNDRETDARTRDRLRELEQLLATAREEMQKASDRMKDAVRRDQGRQNAGRVLGILPDGQVAPVDMRMAGQAQSDFTEQDETSVTFIRNNPFRLLNGYPVTDGIILRSASGTPFLLGVTDAGEVEIREFVRN